MALPDLTGQNIENTYQRILQTPDGGTTIYDGTGSLITLTATAAAGGSNTQIQFNSASLLSGSSNFSFDYVNNSVILTGSLNITGSTTQIGNNNLFGNTSLSGSIIISGSTTTPTVQIYGNTTHNGYIRFDPVTTNINSSLSASYIYVSGSTNDLYFTQNGNGYANTTRLRWLEGNLYTGLLHGGLISSASSTTFNISSGSGIIVNLNASLTVDPYPTIQFIEWGNLTNQTLTYRTTAIQTFLGIDSNGQIVQQTDPWTDGQYNTSISLGTVLHQNLSTINGTISYPNVAYGWKQRSYDFVKAFGPLKISGFTLRTSSSLGLTVDGGVAFAEGRNYQFDPNNPSYCTDTGTTVSKIFRYYQSGSTFVQDTNGGTGYTGIDTTQFNLNGSGSLTAVSPSKFYVHRIFWYPKSVTKGIVDYYGLAPYDTLDEAQTKYINEPFVEVPNTQQNAIFLGIVIVKGNSNFNSANDYRVVQGGLFRSAGIGGGGGGATTLAGLTDVSLSSLVNGDLLSYNSSTGKWDNTHTLSGSYTLSGSLTTNDGVQVQTLTASFVSASGGITGSLLGTSSWAQSASVAVSSSYALSASYAPIGPGATDTLALWNSNSTVTSSSITYLTGVDATNNAIVSESLYNVNADGLKIGTATNWTQISSSVNSNINVNNISPAGNYISIPNQESAIIKHLDLYQYNKTSKTGCYGMIIDFNIMLTNRPLAGDQSEFVYDSAAWPNLDTPYYVETGRIYLSWLGADYTNGGAVGRNNIVTYLTMSTPLINAASIGWDEVDSLNVPTLSRTSLAASEEGVVAPYGAPVFRNQNTGYQFGYKLVNDPGAGEWYVEVAMYNDTTTLMYITHTSKILTLFTNP